MSLVEPISKPSSPALSLLLLCAANHISFKTSFQLDLTSLSPKSVWSFCINIYALCTMVFSLQRYASKPLHSIIHVNVVVKTKLLTPHTDTPIKLSQSIKAPRKSLQCTSFPR